MTPPRWVWAPALVAVAFVVVPLVGVVIGVPWGRLGSVLTSAESLDALWLSVRTALASTALVVLLGVPLALALDSLRGRVAAVVRTMVLAPLVLPPVVSGLALLAAFGRRGLLGSALGGHVAFSTLAVVLAQAFVSLPFLVLTVAGALRSRDRRLEQAAATLGASPTRVLWRVTLPLVAPSLLTGTVLALARALGEFGATLTFAGSLQGVTRTLPLEIYLQREIDPDAALGLSLLLLGLAVAVVGLVHGPVERHPLRSRRPGSGDGVAASAARRRRVAIDGAETPAARRRLVPDETPAAPPAADQCEPVALAVDASVPGRAVAVAVSTDPGEVVAVVGPNGAGKSTLLGIVAGLVPAQGSVLLDGRDLAAVPPHRRGIGWVAQDDLLLPHLTVLDNVAFGPRSRGSRRGPARARAREWLAAFGAQHLADRAPATLSGGQAQRVAIARALAASPRVLLLDEPFAALDVESADTIRSQVRRVLAGRPTTCLLVTHSARDVRALAGRVAVIEDGRVTTVGPADEVLASSEGFAARLTTR